MSIVPALVHAFAPWQSLYSNSKTTETVVTSTHLVAMLFGGGFAVGADRATLRASVQDADGRRRLLQDLGTVHRPVLIALAVLFVSGVALAAADVATFAKSPAFALKLVLVALLLANGFVLTRTETALQAAAAPGADQAREDRLWRRLRTTARLSLVLWTVTVVAGTVLVNAA
jgi:heme/copper-type cytochrome/quinol oxidase subunit 3